MDKNVKQVIEKYTARAKHGKEKYGVTTERKDLSLRDWLNHLQEELMDATVYLERIKGEVNSIFVRICPDCDGNGYTFNDFWQSDTDVCDLCHGEGTIDEL